MAWFLDPQRRWLGEHLDERKYDCGYVSLPQRCDITAKRTSPSQWLKHVILALKARWHLIWHRYDVVVSAFPQVGFLVEMVKRLTFDHTPHVIWYFNCGHEYQGARRRLSQFAFASVRRFIVYTEREREVYSRVFSLPKDRFHFTFLTGVPLAQEHYRGARERFGLESRYIVALGSSGRDYGLFLKATAGLGVQSVIVTHQYALAGLEIPPWVKVIESIPQEDYLRIIAEAEICVIPINNAQTASGQMTLIQAMSLGVPVIATRCIGTEDYIVPGETGFLVEMGDANGLHEAIRTLLEDAELRVTMAQKAKRFAEEHFFDATGSKVLDALYDDLERKGELRAPSGG